MIDIETFEESAKWNCDRGFGYKDIHMTCHEAYVIITRLRQAEMLNSELKDRISHIGLDVGIATTGHVPSEHPIKSRLEMVANIAKDASRYRWLRDVGCFEGSADDFFWVDTAQSDLAIDEAMQCNGDNK